MRSQASADPGGPLRSEQPSSYAGNARERRGKHGRRPAQREGRCVPHPELGKRAPAHPELEHRQQRHAEQDVTLD